MIKVKNTVYFVRRIYGCFIEFNNTNYEPKSILKQ